MLLTSLTLLAALTGAAAPTAGQAPPADPVIRVGLIGLDTSHAGAFTALLNDPARPDHIRGARVVAAFKGGSPDVEASASRIEKFTADLRDTWRIEIVDSIDQLVARVDAVILTSVDGRVHLDQARPVLAARKPLFVDKPFTASVRDAIELARLARDTRTPIFSSSSLRFTDDVVAIKRDPRVAEVLGAITWGPAPLEPHHPDLFWYGIHAVEMLYAFMGPGCERVTRAHTAGADVVVGHWKDGRLGVVRGIRNGASQYGQVVFGPKAIVSAPLPSMPLPPTAATPAPAGTPPATVTPPTTVAPAITGATSNTSTGSTAATPARAAPPVKRSSYHGLLTAVVEFFRTGQSPVPIDETLEIMAFMEAADLSKARGGVPVTLADVHPPR